MDGCGAVAVSAAFQVDPHAAVSVNTLVAVVYLLYLLMDFRFLGIVIRLPVLFVVVIGIWAETLPPQEPADAEFLMMMIDKPVSL